MNIRDTLQGIRYAIEDGEDVGHRLSAFDSMIDDLGKLKAECIDKPERAAALVVEFCDGYGILVAR